MVNTIENYGRTTSLDIHCESYRVTKNIPDEEDSIPPNDTRYSNIWVTTYDDSDGKKLLFGTQTFSTLVTSSLRLESKLDAETGPSTVQFLLTPAESKEIKIYLNKSAIQKPTEFILSTICTSFAS